MAKIISGQELSEVMRAEIADGGAAFSEAPA
jgi:hypothetical protein